MTIMDEDNNENIENANEQIREMITRESFVCQNGHYKHTFQCENTFWSAFTLLQSNNLVLIQNLNKISKLAGGRVLRGGGGCPHAPP